MHKLIGNELPDLKIIPNRIERKPMVEEISSRYSLEGKALHYKLQEKNDTVYNQKVFNHRWEETKSKSGWPIIITHKFFLYFSINSILNHSMLLLPEESFLQGIQVKLPLLLKHAKPSHQVLLSQSLLRNLLLR